MNKFYQESLSKLEVVAEQIPELAILGEKGLRAECRYTHFEAASETCGKLEETLKHIREITGVGRGLAANQLGSTERCFVALVDNEFHYFIDPNVVSVSEETNWYRENCLSCGPIVCDIERSKTITLSFINKIGVRAEGTFDSFLARLLQHELDHLNGIVNVDKVSIGGITMAQSSPLGEELRAESS